jgi:hypothetical protein
VGGYGNPPPGSYPQPGGFRECLRNNSCDVRVRKQPLLLVVVVLVNRSLALVVVAAAVVSNTRYVVCM